MTDKIAVKVTPLPHFVGLDLPKYETAGSAGLDLRAALGGDDVIVAAGAHAIIPTGLSIALPQGYELQIRPRSGLAAKHGVSVLNSPGTIDSDYRGEIKIILINHGTDAFSITHGARIAQAVLAPVVQLIWQAVESLDETTRGTAGFGSTGT